MASTLPASIVSVAEAVRTSAASPADAIRCLSNMVDYYPSIPTPLSSVSIAQAWTVIITAALCRWSALTSLALACADYRPTSYDDAQTILDSVVTLFDQEIIAAADLEMDASYLALRQLRTAVVSDLTTRGSLLPRLITVTLKAPVSALELAYSMYGDATRADEIAQRADVQHPGFLPASMQLLSE